MTTKFRKFHTEVEIRGLDKDSVGLKDLAWAYIESETSEALKDNCQALIDRLEPACGRDYIEGVWRHKEDRAVRYYTRLNFNLGCFSSQRSESYHVVIKAITHGQLSLENSATELCRTVVQLIQDMEAQKDQDLTQLSRLAQAPTFRHIRMSITNWALTQVAIEWDRLCATIAPQTELDINNCECEILLQFGLPCLHHLHPYRREGAPIPRSLCHPRWWIPSEHITATDWVPSGEHTPRIDLPQPIFTSVEQQLLELRESLDSEGREQLDRRRERRQEMVNRELLDIATRQLQLQAIPIQQPKPISKHNFMKIRTARGLTANE